MECDKYDMHPLDVQLPHAKMSVQCNTLNKNITTNK